MKPSSRTLSRTKNPMKPTNHPLRTLHVFFGLALLGAQSISFADEWPNRPDFGTNLDAPADFRPVLPFADLMKQARSWQYDFKDDAEKPELDALGNWKPVPGKTVFATVALGEAAIPGGAYVVTWSGTGKVGIKGRLKEGRILKEEANRMEFEVPARSDIWLEIKESSPDDPVRDVHCWLPGTEGQESPFNPAFKQYLPPFGTLRFMDWMETNSSHQEKWTNRPVPEQQTFRVMVPKGASEKSVGDTHLGGVPVELMVDLCNETKSNPWFCLPHKADDEYVRNFARYVKDHLDPALKIYLEYSNEIWNNAPAFQQTKWAREKGLAMGIPEGQDPAAAWYAKRSLEIWNIWEEVFGGRERHVRVLAAFASVPRNAEMKLQYLGDPKLADPGHRPLRRVLARYQDGQRRFRGQDLRGPAGDG